MYKTILIPVEDSVNDWVILNHIQELAKCAKSKLILISVAHGWAARNYDFLKLRESSEMQRKRQYLASLVETLREKGFDAESIFAYGDPSTEIIRVARGKGVDLIAMSTHGHRFLLDILLGSVSSDIAHSVNIPVLLLCGKKD